MLNVVAHCVAIELLWEAHTHPLELLWGTLHYLESSFNNRWSVAIKVLWFHLIQVQRSSSPLLLGLSPT